MTVIKWSKMQILFSMKTTSSSAVGINVTHKYNQFVEIDNVHNIVLFSIANGVILGCLYIDNIANLQHLKSHSIPMNSIDGYVILSRFIIVYTIELLI